MTFSMPQAFLRRVIRGVSMLTVLGMASWSVAGQTSELSGVVTDASGAPVPGVAVEVIDGSGSSIGQAETGNDGRFVIPNVAAGNAVVIARALGFADAVAQVSVPVDSVPLVLYPAPIFDQVTVTATRGVSDLDTLTSTSVLSSADIALSPAGALDDALLYTPGFSLFRRASSRTANPTAQGVTLRGVSGSGASRTKVLADGVPLNDPFGNWVYWNRIPAAAIDKVEVVRGAAGDLYGTSALGGVIQVLTFDPRRPMARVTVDGGSHDTIRVSGFGGSYTDGWSYLAAVEVLETEGVVTTGAELRGDVDVDVFSDYRTGFAGFGYTGPDWGGRLRVSIYDEERGNGTVLQVNDTQRTDVSGTLRGTTQRGQWSVSVDGGTQSYYQTFSAVASDRNSERLARFNDGPTDFFSVSGQWVQSFGDHVLLVGGEGRRVEGLVDSTSGFSGRTDHLGGTENSGGVFGQVRLAVNDRTAVRFGARGDFWRANPLRPEDPEHSANFFSPRATVSYLAREDVSIQGSVYRSWRNPTLNELFRGFRVGAISTLANPLLEPERLTGVEGGIAFTRGDVSARVTGFFNNLDDAVANVTIRTNVRQRQNADQIRSAGVEMEADFRPDANVSLGVFAAFTNAEFQDSTRPDLGGNRVPQLPQWQFGGTFTYSDPRYVTVSVQARGLGDQFDDDLNRNELGAFGVVDAYVSRSVARGVNIFFSAENLFDQEYDVSTNPRRIGWPQTFRVGVRATLP